MAEGLDSLIEPLEKLLSPNSQRFFMKSEGAQELMKSLISTFREFRKNTMKKLSSLMTSEDVDSLFVFVKALYLQDALKIGRSRSLPSLYEDGVNNGRSNDGVGPFRVEEDNHVSSGNNEGRLDDHSGSKDVSARLISVPDGIEEPDPEAGETHYSNLSAQTNNKKKKKKKKKKYSNPSWTDAHGTDGLESSVQPDNHVSSVPDVDGGENPTHGTDGLECSVQPDNHVSSVPDADVAHGTDGLERSVQYVMEPKLWQVVDELFNSGNNWEGMLEKFELENDMRNTPYSDQLNQITNNVRSEFQQLLQLQKRDPSLSSEDLKADLKVYCVPLCWSSTRRVVFFCQLSNRLWKPKVYRQQDDSQEVLLLNELESKGSFIFNGHWAKEVEEWMKSIDPRFKLDDSNYKSVECLLRFVRNRWYHPDKFQDSKELRNMQSFYNYLDRQFHERFSILLKLSYRAAYRFCKQEPWFKDYLPSRTI